MASAAALLPSAAAAALLLLLSLLSPGADARPGVHFHPCKTLFISYSFSSSAAPLDLSQNSADPKPFGSFTVYRIVRPLRPYYYSADLRRPIRIERPREALPAEPAFGTSSLHDRAKDILFVVVGLLFGVGCGALTAVTIYLAWSLLTNRYEVCGWYEDDDEEEADENPKKMGYVKIVDPAPAPTKEGYEGN